MPRLLIKYKIAGGFAFLIILLAVSASISNYSLKKTKSTVRSVIDEAQPFVLKAHQFNGEVSRSASALGNYLLTKDPAQKVSYQKTLKMASLTLNDIVNAEKVKQSERLAQQIKQLQEKFNQFKQYETRMLKLATSVLDNQPALKYASENTNPHSLSMLGALSAMIDSELDEDFDEDRQEWYQLMNDTRYNYQRLISEVRIYLTQPAETNKKNMLLNLEQAKNLVAQFPEYSDLYTFEQEEGAEIISNNFWEYSEDIHTLIKLSESERRRIDLYLLNKEILPLLSTIQNLIDRLVSEQAGIMKKSSQQLLQEVDQGLSLQFTLAAVGIVLGILVALIIIRIVTVPLNMTMRALQEVAQGDGDLTRRINVKSKDELGMLADAFNQFSIKLQGIVSEISLCSNQLTESSDQMNHAAMDNQITSSTQNSQIDQISSAIESMQQQLSTVAESTEQAADLAEQVNKDSQNGRNIVESSLRSSNQLADNVEQAAGVINQLETDVISISGVLDVIRDIAEQTNLLALNAAIEAARAGEHGRGFAVVADEVRTLASRTQEATEEIKTTISHLQSGSENAVKAMNNGKEMAEQGVEQSQQADHSLAQINQATDGMLNMNREIANASDQQRIAVDQVGQNVIAINKMASQNVKGSNVIAQSGKNVNQLAEQLHGLVGQFKI